MVNYISSYFIKILKTFLIFKYKNMKNDNTNDIYLKMYGGKKQIKILHLQNIKS